MGKRLLSAIAFAMLLSIGGAAQTVVDGDIIKVDDTIFRVWGIDAMETQQICADDHQSDPVDRWHDITAQKAHGVADVRVAAQYGTSSDIVPSPTIDPMRKSEACR
jgi:hypothetical protein